MMRRSFISTGLIAVLGVAATGLAAWGQNPQPLRMWYRGSFEGWVEKRNTPQPGWYYSPSTAAAYPLNESAYGYPIYCSQCRHYHMPGAKDCAVCGRDCRAGGSKEDPRTVYRPQRLPGAYYYKEQPHYRFVSPMRLGGTYQKYSRPYQ